MGIVHVNVYFDWFREYFFWWIKIFLMSLQALLFSLMGGLLLDLKIQFFCLHHENTLLLCNGTVTTVKLKWFGMWVLLTARLYNWSLTHHSSPCTCDSPVDMLPCTRAEWKCWEDTALGPSHRPVVDGNWRIMIPAALQCWFNKDQRIRLGEIIQEPSLPLQLMVGKAKPGPWLWISRSGKKWESWIHLEHNL